MVGFENLLKTAQVYGKQAGLHSTFAQFFESQQAWKKSFTSLSMFNEIAKTLRNQKALINDHSVTIGGLRDWAAISKAILPDPTLTALGATGFKHQIFPKAILADATRAAISGLQHHQIFSKAILPDVTLAAIGGIGLQYQAIFSQLRAANEALQKAAMPNHFTGLQAALQGITSQIASVSAQKRRWDLIEDFEEISSNAVSISESISEKESITGDDIEIIKDFLGRIETKIDAKDTDWFSILLKWMAVIGFVLSVIAEVRNYENKPEAATKQDIEQLKKEIQEKIETKLLEQNDSACTNRLCNIRYKPLSHSRAFTQLPEVFNVAILSTKGKWAYISYINPADGLAETGWVLKKYLHATSKRKR